MKKIYFVSGIAGKLPNADEAILDNANSFIAERYNYIYDSIRKYVEANI